MEKDPLWADFKKNLTKNISFMIEDDSVILPEKKELISIDSPKKQNKEEGYCLITG